MKFALAWKSVTLIRKAQETYIPLNNYMVKLCIFFYIYKQKKSAASSLPDNSEELRASPWLLCL